MAQKSAETANRLEATSPYPHAHHNICSLQPPLISSQYQNIVPLTSPCFRLRVIEGVLPFLIAGMATMNSRVLACSYSISGTSEASRRLMLPPSVTPMACHAKLPAVRAQQIRTIELKGSSEGRRAALSGIAAVVFSAAAAATSSPANAGIIEEYLEKSKANKELNDKKRLATSGANLARAYTVEFGTCKFPDNFTGCQDLAKQKKVKFLTDDLEIECDGKDKYKCGSNVFWKW